MVAVEKSIGGGLVDMVKDSIKYITTRDFFGKIDVKRSAMFPYQPLSSSLDEADKVEAKVRRKIFTWLVKISHSVKTRKTEVDYRRSQSDLECHCVERVHEVPSYLF